MLTLSHSGALLRRSRSERGAILPLFAIVMPVVVFFAAFVLEVGNWFEHQRHLQTQADAAALAGGGVWSFPCTAAAETMITSTARNYGGPDATNPAALYNAQIGGTPASRLHMLLNSKDFYNQGLWGDNTDPAGSPCNAGFLDTKATESNLPFFIPFAGSVVPAINAHARVSILQAASLNGMLPLFVRDVTPKSAAAIFIDDASHTVLGAAFMDKLPSTSCTSGRQCWSSIAAPSTITIARRTSLVVALSSYDRCPASGAPCMALPAAGSSADTACLQSGVECYGEDPATSSLQTGIVFIRGYSTSGSGAPPNPPLLRDVELTGFGTGGATCADGYFSFATSTCSVYVRAKVDAGSLTGSGDVALRANGNDLAYDSSDGYFKGTISVSPATDPPTQPVTIAWAARNTTITGFGACGASFKWTGTGCHDTFEPANVVQRVYAGQDQFSGPIRAATVWNGDNPVAPFAGFGANAYPIGSSHTLFASVSLAGSVATDVSDPPIELRVAGSQAAIDCDPAITNFRDELTLGCGPFYTFNVHLTQPDPCNPPYGTNNPSLFSSPNPPPWQCVATQTGVSVGQFTQGIQGRILNNKQLCSGSCPSTCPATGAGRNYWSADWVGGTFNVNDDDPRLVTLFMVPFGAFRGSGNSLFPITNFGSFYVTGWGGNGGGNDDPCPGADPGIPGGWLSGHFITNTLPFNSGGGTIPCDPAGTTPCVAVLTN